MTAPAKTPKVFGIGIHSVTLADGTHLRNARVVVAAPSRAAAVRALNDAGVRVTANHFKDYGSETGNETEVAVASSSPGTVFAGSNELGADRAYRRVTPTNANDTDGGTS